MKTTLIFLFLVVTGAWAQPATLDVSGAGAGAYGAVKFNDNSALGQKVASKIDYSEVRGKYFWNSTWDSAVMTLNSGNLIKVPQAKLNMYTDEIHYFDKSGVELAAPSNQVKKVTFFNAGGDTIAQFERRANGGNTPGEGFHQILNSGKIQLIKKTTVTLKKKNYDPSVGKAEYSFVSSINYFLKEGDATQALKKLSKDSFTGLVHLKENEIKWLTDSGNKLKSESDFIRALEYINASPN